MIITVNKCTFSLRLTEQGLKELRHEIGEYDESSSGCNIALYEHFCREPKTELEIDFEMVFDFLEEITTFKYSKAEQLKKFKAELIKLTETATFKNWVGW